MKKYLLCNLAGETAIVITAVTKGPFTLELTSAVVSAKSSIFALSLLPPTASHSNIGHKHIHGTNHHAIFESGVDVRSKMRGNRKLFALTTTLVSASINRPSVVVTMDTVVVINGEFMTRKNYYYERFT